MFFWNMIEVAACNTFVVFTNLNPELQNTKKNKQKRICLLEVGQ